MHAARPRALAAVAALLAAGCTTAAGSTGSSEPAGTELAATAAADPDLDLAPEAERVDTATPSFSDPTRVDNPLFPIADLPSALLLATATATSCASRPPCCPARG